MFKLFYGLIIFGLIVYVITELVKESKRAKVKLAELEDLEIAKKDLRDLEAQEDVLGVKEQIVSQQKRIMKLENKIAKKTANLPNPE